MAAGGELRVPWTNGARPPSSFPDLFQRRYHIHGALLHDFPTPFLSRFLFAVDDNDDAFSGAFLAFKPAEIYDGRSPERAAIPSFASANCFCEVRGPRTADCCGLEAFSFTELTLSELLERNAWRFSEYGDANVLLAPLAGCCCCRGKISSPGPNIDGRMGNGARFRRSSSTLRQAWPSSINISKFASTSADDASFCFAKSS